MSGMDFNDADPQRGSFDLIPDGTVVLVVANLRPGGHGPGNWLKPNKDGSCLMADFEFVVDGGEYDRRKFWTLFITEGTTEGQQKAANISRSKLRGMLESAFGVNPGDDSPDAMAKRQVAGWQTFDGLKFCARIGVEQGKGDYKDKNVLAAAVTPDEPDYIAPGPQLAGARSVGAVAGAVAAAAGAKAANAANGAAKAAGKPAWAQ